MRFHRSAARAADRLRQGRRATAAGMVSAALSVTGCLPYPVATTAQPLPAGEAQRTASVYFIPNAISLRDEMDSARRAPSAPLRGSDLEYRRGIDSVSDIAVHIPAMSGIVIDYKRKLGGATDSAAAATALLVGAGVVNLAEHAYGEVGLVHSGRSVAGRVAYGGVRVMQVAPIAEGAVHDLPTAGGFVGVRIPMADLALSPELGLYYDHSALGVRRGDLLFVPSLSVATTRRRRIDRELPTPTPPVFNGTGGNGTPGSPGVIIRRPAGAPGRTTAPRRPPQRPAAGPIPTPSGARPIQPPKRP